MASKIVLSSWGFDPEVKRNKSGDSRNPTVPQSLMAHYLWCVGACEAGESISASWKKRSKGPLLMLAKLALLLQCDPTMQQQKAGTIWLAAELPAFDSLCCCGCTGHGSSNIAHHLSLELCHC